MNRVARSALLALSLLSLVALPLASCGGDDHAGHEHKPGETHDDHPKDTKPK